MKKEVENPFLEYGYVSPKYFCDRERETIEIISSLKNGRNLTLVSPRRMGKTGLIKNVFYKLREQQPDIVTLYMDIFPTQNMGEFVRLFAGTVLGQLDSAPQKAMSRITKFVKSIRPMFTLDEFSGKPQVTIDVSPMTEQATLKEIFDYLASSEQQCYIAIDEFQQVTEYPEKGLEAALRSYIQDLPNVHFIFSGSRQHVMQEMFLSAKRPFYQSAHTLSIGSIDKHIYYDFAAEFFAGRSLSEETFSYIYDTFGGHTWYIQVILNRLYGYCRKVDLLLVQRAIEQIIAENMYAYETLLAAYPQGSIKLLKAIAKAGSVKEVNSSGFIAANRLKAASSVNVSLRKLLDKELIYKSIDGYMVYDRFMAIWLKQLPY
ncbi:AAA family ATPase [Bacteroides sp. UBA939]|uniref:AAA family ATPase n=1 Tax=Bacteroides sp. UBA939 TaxID=1946092 RepID=UPI0025C1662E|nr:ATP-binding protein [Bacteroides sp. UBA939]